MRSYLLTLAALVLFVTCALALANWLIPGGWIGKFF
ncbi:hypothetical protein BurMR1_1892 [Burkholderia sp. MR1]|nr:hypothetical protein BurMR1_1892 [Burkholderia sp. MR1]